MHTILQDFIWLIVFLLKELEIKKNIMVVKNRFSNETERANQDIYEDFKLVYTNICRVCKG